MMSARSMKNSKTNAEMYFEKAIAAKNAGHFQRAKQWFSKAAALCDRKKQALFWLMAADCDKQQGRLSDALQSLRIARRCNPTSHMALISIGLLHLEMKKPKLAQRIFQKAVHCKPTAVGYIFLGKAFCQQGQFNQSKSCYLSALRLEPDNEEAHYNLGVCCQEGRQYSRAEKHFRRAIEIDPKYAWAYAELGSVLFKKKRYQESYKALQRSVKLDPDYYWSRLYLAVTNVVLGHLKEAQKQYHQAIRIAPQDSLGYTLLGDFLSMEQRADAEKYLKKAIALDPSCESALYYMSKHLLRNNRGKEAMMYLRKAARKGHDEAKVLLNKVGMIH